MNKRYFVVSDIEMGKRDIMDDFSDDDHLAEFIQYISQNDFEGQTHLILNGDIFDFLKMDYKGEYTRYITEEISMWKLEEVFKAHPKVFEAFKRFLTNPHHFIFFVIGNHDFDLVWPSLQTKIKERLENTKQVKFDFAFTNKDIHIEHGNIVDPFFEYNEKQPFIDFKGKRILNLPVGCHVVFAYLAPFKKKFPKEEQLYPRSKMVHHRPDYYRQIRRMMWKNIFKALIDRLFHLNDPTYKINYRAFFRHVFQFGFEFIIDENFLPYRIKKLHFYHPDKQIYVLGHTHIFTEMNYANKRFLFTDTWRDEYNFMLEGHPKKKKTYVEIHYDDIEVKKAETKVFVPKFSTHRTS